jgi:hypothetical protein
MRAVSLLCLLCVIPLGCGEHKSKVERRERIQQRSREIPKPTPDPISDEKVHDDHSAELNRAEADLSAARAQLLAMEAELADAKKTGFTGCKFFTSKNCVPCKRGKVDIKGQGFTVGPSDKFHFWEIETDDEKAHPLVPHFVYFANGKQLPGEIVGYDGSEKALAQIIAKHPLAHKGKPEARSAAVETGAGHASVPAWVPPPVPGSEDVEYQAPVTSDCGGFQSGCGQPSFGCSAPMSYSYGSPAYSYQAPTYAPQNYSSFGFGVGFSRCANGVCW